MAVRLNQRQRLSRSRQPRVTGVSSAGSNGQSYGVFFSLKELMLWYPFCLGLPTGVNLALRSYVGWYGCMMRGIGTVDLNDMHLYSCMLSEDQAFLIRLWVLTSWPVRWYHSVSYDCFFDNEEIMDVSIYIFASYMWRCRSPILSSSEKTIRPF